MGVFAMFGVHPQWPIRSYVEGIGANVFFWIRPRMPIRAYVEGTGEIGVTWKACRRREELAAASLCLGALGVFPGNLRTPRR